MKEDSDPTIKIPIVPITKEEDFDIKEVTFLLSERQTRFLLKKAQERGISYEVYLSSLLQKTIEVLITHEDFSEAYYELSRYHRKSQGSKDDPCSNG